MTDTSRTSNLHVDTLLLEEIGNCILRLAPEAEERFVGLGVGSLRALQRMVQSKLEASRSRRNAVETSGPGTPIYRLTWLLNELEKRFPNAHHSFLSDPSEQEYIALIDALLARSPTA